MEAFATLKSYLFLFISALSCGYFEPSFFYFTIRKEIFLTSTFHAPPFT
jgi:hypothetical protein